MKEPNVFNLVKNVKKNYKEHVNTVEMLLRTEPVVSAVGLLPHNRPKWLIMLFYYDKIRD